MDKLSTYIEYLKNNDTWEPFLLAESGLPGPRGNLELMAAVADSGSEGTFMALIHSDLHQGSETANEFLPCCGVVGLGSLLAKNQKHVLPILHQYANDNRWRLREAVAMAFQRWGKADMEALLDEMEIWGRGSLLEQRTAAAAICEPVLLGQAAHAKRVLSILDEITASLTAVRDRKTEDFRVLRKGLAYCWSVAAAALPEEGKQLMEKWMLNPDADVRWIMKENLKKKRLARSDAQWVEVWSAKLA